MDDHKPSFADLLRDETEDEEVDEAQPRKIPLDEQRSILIDFNALYDSQRFANEPPFAAGDLVMPRSDSIMKHGSLYIVLEVDGNAAPDLACAPIGTHLYGRYPDMRVGRVDPHGAVLMFWGEFTDFDPYIPEPYEAP